MCSKHVLEEYYDTLHNIYKRKKKYNKIPSILPQAKWHFKSMCYKH